MTRQSILELAAHVFRPSRLHRSPGDPYTIGKPAASSFQLRTSAPHVLSHLKKKSVDVQQLSRDHEEALEDLPTSCDGPPETPETRGQPAQAART